MRSPLLAVLSVVVVLAVLGLIARPRLLLRPVVWVFAVWTWIKTIVLLPVNVHEWLVASALEKHASALASHASCASALWSANAEFRPAAREIYGRVCAGYGVFPARAGTINHGEDLPAGAAARTPPGEDPYDALNRSAAAQAVQRSRGGLKSVETPAATDANASPAAGAPKS